MTTEEIKKAVKDYTESLKSIAFENLSGEEMPYLVSGAYKEGIEFTNKHWQEKTKWIPFPSKKMPELYKDYLVKYDLLGKKCVDIMTFRNTERLGQRFIKIVDMGLGDGVVSYPVTHWKEIEL